MLANIFIRYHRKKIVNKQIKAYWNTYQNRAKLIWISLSKILLMLFILINVDN